MVKELTARTKLEYDVVVLACFGELDKLDDVGMVKLSHDLDFFEDVGAL